MQIAKYYGVPPWELLDRPAYWLHLGVACMGAENELQARERKKEQRQAKQRGG